MTLKFLTRPVCVLIAMGCAFFVATSLTDAADKITYQDHIVPLFRNHCFSCHNADQKKGDLDLSNFTSLMQGGGSGGIVESGNASESRLWKLVNHDETPHMPPKKPKLPEAELALVKNWIEGGLLQNAGSKAIVSKKPKVNLALSTTPTGRPKGAPPMPNGDLLLDPVVHAKRTGAVTAMAASPWAPLVAVAGQRQILLYNTDTMRLAGILPFNEGIAHVLRFSRSGRLLLAGGGLGGKAGKVVLFDITTGRRVLQVGDEYDAVLAADLSGDQTHIALGGPSKLIRIFSTSTGQRIHSIKKHTDWVTSIAFSPDGVLLATGDRNGGVHVWEAHTGRIFYTLNGHKGAITQLTWRDDSNVLASSSEDGQVMLWEMARGRRVKAFRAHDKAMGVVYDHAGNLFTTGRDRTTKYFDGNGTQKRAIQDLPEISLQVAVTHDGKRVIAGDWSGVVRIWNVADGKRIGELSTNPLPLSARLDGEGKRLVSLQGEHKVLAATALAGEQQLAKVKKALADSKVAAAANAKLVVTATSMLATAQKAVVQSTAARDAATKMVAVTTTQLTTLTNATSVARKSEAQAKIDVANAQKLVANLQVKLNAISEAATKAKQASDMMKDDPQLKQAAGMLLSSQSKLQKTKSAADVTVVAAIAKMKTASQTAAKAQIAQANAAKALDVQKKLVAAKAAELKQLSLKIKPATDTLTAAKASSAASAKAVVVLDTQVKTVAASHAKQVAMASDKARQVNLAKSAIQQLKAAQVNTKVLALRPDVEIKQAQLKAILEELSAVSDREFNLLDQLEVAHKAVKQAPSTLKSATDAIVHANNSLVSLKANVVTAEKKLAAQQLALVTANKSLGEAQTQAAKLAKVAKSTTDLVAAQSAAVAAANEAAAKAKAASTEMIDVAELKQVAAMTQQSATQVQGVLAMVQQALSKANANKDDANKRVGANRTAVTQANVAVALAQKNAQGAAGVVKTSSAKVVELQKALAVTKADLAALPAKIDTMKKQLVALEKESKVLREDSNKASVEFVPFKKKYDDLVREYHQLKGTQPSSKQAG